MEPLPPKTLKNQLVRLDNNLKQIERNQFAGIQRAPGSLPVLEAFQEFLDNERRKARHRMMALTSVFVVVLLIVGAGAGSAVYFQMKRMAVDYADLVAQTDALETTLAAARDTTRSSLAAIETRLGETSESSQTRHDELLAAQTDVADRVKADSIRMAEMQSILDRLAGENDALKADLEQVMQDWPSVTRQVAELMDVQTSSPKHQPKKTATVAEGVSEEVVEAATPVADTEPATSPVRAAKAPVTQTAPSVVALTLVPQGEKHGIRWRLPATLE